jgi:hypothetical protein
MAEPGTIYVRLDYSMDGGTTWLPTTAVDLRASEYSVTVPPETVIEQKFEAYRRLREIRKGRIKVYLKFDADNFGSHDTGDTKLCYVQDWLRKPLLRIWTHNGAATPAGVNVDGRSYFAASNNAYFLWPDGDPEVDILSDFIKFHEVRLKSRDALD